MYFINYVFDYLSYILCQSQLSVHSYDLAGKYQWKQKRQVFVLYFLFFVCEIGSWAWPEASLACWFKSYVNSYLNIIPCKLVCTEVSFRKQRL